MCVAVGDESRHLYVAIQAFIYIVSIIGYSTFNNSYLMYTVFIYVAIQAMDG